MRIKPRLALPLLALAVFTAQAQTNDQCRVDSFGNRVCNGVVDLSRVGLDGIEAAQKAEESRERLRASELERERQEFELERERERWRLEQEEAQRRQGEAQSRSSQAVLSQRDLEQRSAARADQTMSVGDWLRASKQPRSSQEFISALVLAGNVLFQWEGKSHCKPERADVDQAMAIAAKFFEEHPQVWHLAAPDGIGAALGNVWPCGEQP